MLRVSKFLNLPMVSTLLDCFRKTFTVGIHDQGGQVAVAKTTQSFIVGNLNPKWPRKIVRRLLKKLTWYLILL